jgi:hypothetical protein
MTRPSAAPISRTRTASVEEPRPTAAWFVVLLLCQRCAMTAPDGTPHGTGGAFSYAGNLGSGSAEGGAGEGGNSGSGQAGPGPDGTGGAFSYAGNPASGSAEGGVGEGGNSGSGGLGTASNGGAGVAGAPGAAGIPCGSSSCCVPLELNAAATRMYFVQGQGFLDVALVATELPTSPDAYWTVDVEVTYEDGSAAVCQPHYPLSVGLVGPIIASCPAVPMVQATCGGTFTASIRVISRTYQSLSTGETSCEDSGSTGAGASIQVPIACPACPSEPVQAATCDYPKQLQCLHTTYNHWLGTYDRLPCRCDVLWGGVQRQWFCAVF